MTGSFTHVTKKHGILNKVRGNKDIVISHPGKRNGVVIMNRKDNDKAICDILENNSKFKRLKKDPTLLKEGQLQCFIRTFKNKTSLMKTHIQIYIL